MQTEIEDSLSESEWNFFSLRVAEQWNRLPRKVMDFPSLEIFKIWLDMVLNNLLWMPLLEQEDGIR